MPKESQAELPSERFLYTVSLTRLSDGKTVEIQEEWGFPGYVRRDDWESDFVFIWEEGNFSCDCNREDFFCKASGEPEVERNCGNGVYRVNWLRNDETGKVFDYCGL